ncbi:hypothetical protein B7463_g6755, partial [Scytalidium lignicola]
MSVADSQSDDFDMIDSREASLGPEALEKLQKWLQPTDYMAESSEFRRHLSSQAPGTGLWICDTEKFQQWHDSADHGSLWIKGVPGAGKSVTAASMVEHLRSQEDVPVLFFFFRYILDANRRPRSLIRDWLAQLLPHSLKLQASLQPMLACELTDLSDERLWEHLLIGLSSIGKAYCVVDALDEMEFVENDPFLVRLNSLATFRSNSVKLLITSRPKQYLQSSVRDTSIVHISLEDDLVGKDIAHFVSHRLKMAIPENNNADLLNSLVSTVCTRSRGLFLYARLLLDQIGPVLQSEKQVDVEALAKSLPIGLEDMYNSMLSQQAEALNIETSLQVFLLECTIHSSRNLRLNELANFLQFKFPSSMIPGTAKAIARTACAPLLEIMEDETVQVIHHSFTEFLLDRQRTTRLGQTARQFPILDPQGVHRMLIIACLEYLQSGVLKSEELPRGVEGDKDADDDNIKPDKYDYQQARLQYPFLDYAVQNWGYHASKYDVEDESFFVSIKTFTEADSDFRRWLSLVKSAKYLPSTGQAPSLLHIAAFAGLTQFAKYLLHTGHTVDSRDIEDKTPLMWASSSGHVEIVSILLQHGAEPDAEDKWGVKPIHLAARQNSHKIVKMLLEAGVDPLSPKTKEYVSDDGYIMGGQSRTKGDTAVQYACQQGHTETILAMIPFLQPDTLEEVLCETCRYGKFESVRTILENSEVSINSKFTGATALYLACVAKSVNCVQMLLERGANISLISEWKPLPRIYGGGHHAQSPRTPLQGLVHMWNDDSHPACEQIFQMLIRAGADLNERDTRNETPLLSQFQDRGAPSILAVRTLLEAGANISDVYGDGDTVLHRFLAWNRDIEMLDLLLKHGANVTTCGSQRTTVLHSVLKAHSLSSQKNSSQEIVEYLLEKGALAHIKNEFGKSALEEAMFSISSNIDIFRLLLRSCPDESIRKECLWLIGSKPGKEQIQFIRELQAFGISLDARNSKGETVLLSTMRSGDTWKALVECGASLDAIDSNGRGALHHFIRSTSSPEQLQALIDTGLDPHRVDYEDKTMLHIAASGYEGTEREAKLVEYLLNLGLSVNAQTKLGCTPLQLHLENIPEHPRSYSFNEPPRTPLLSVFQKSGDVLNANIQDKEGLSALHLSAMRSELHVAQLLDAGADPTLVTKDGRTALHIACRARRSGVVGFLLHKTNGDIINNKDSFGRTALHDACASGRPESVYYLLKHGADITAKDSQGRTPLHSCAEFGSEEKIWTLLQRRNNPAVGMEINSRYRPPPHHTYKTTSNHWYASKYMDRPNLYDHDTTRIGTIVKSLLAAGADPTVLDSRNKSPLELALSYDCLEMVQALNFTVDEVQKGLGLEPKDFRFYTEVALNQRTRIGCRDLPEDARQEILCHPARYVASLRFDDVDWLIQNKANLTNGDDETIHLSNGDSFLHVVASNGLTEMMESLGNLARFYDDPSLVKSRLLKAGYKNDYLGHFIPILHAACQRKLPNMQMVQILIEKCGVDINGHALVLAKQYGKLETNSADGPTALHRLAEASQWWYLDAIRYLVEHGANINSRNERGETPLHIACGGVQSTNMNSISRPGFWSPDCVRLLLDLGADPNALDKTRMSPLNLAKINPKAMKILLERGADISVGKISPLFSAIQSQDLETLRIILDAGADPNTKDTVKAFHIHYEIKSEERWALFCASFPYIMNMRIEDSAPLVKLLIERGADLYNPVSDSETLIHYVFEHAEYEIASAFMECREMINFDTKDQLGRTVFLAACNSTRHLPQYKRKELVEKRALAIQILEYGADPLVVDNEGRNALHHLLENPQMEEDTVLQFFEHDACKKLLHQTDKKGFTPLNSAFRFLRPVLIEVLLAMGADLLQSDPNGTTALHQIAAQCFLKYKQQRRSWLQEDQDPQYFAQCVSLWNKFLSLGGNINVQNKDGSPPLFLYLNKCNTVDFSKSYEELLDKADVHVRNNDGETALHVIARREKGTGEIDQKLFEFMVAKGLDPLAEDRRGRSSLDVAAACGKNEILGLFQYRS